MTRHELREQTFRMLFGAEFHEEADFEEALRNYFALSYEGNIEEQETEEIIGKVLAVRSRAEELDRDINSVAEGWKTERMGRAELNILRLALYEMKYDDRVPVKVAINEAVELSKAYGSDEAGSFVNGILARLLDRVAPEAETGRTCPEAEDAGAERSL